MKTIEIKKSKGLRGEIIPPPDKSISHRAAIFSSLASGKSVIKNYLKAGDTMSTLRALRALGIEITESDGDVIIEGMGLYGLREPLYPIDCGNSGTTIRLLSGVLSGNSFLSVLFGDASLTQRPMARVIGPLKQMGANILARADDKYPPIVIKGGRLKAIKYEMPVASAQVKSAILLAGLYADGVTTVVEPSASRDHTERMLPAYGARLEKHGLSIQITGRTELHAVDCTVPADFSSAAFFIVAGTIVPDSELLIKGVGLNPTRTGLLGVLEKMGAKIEILNRREIGGEPVGDIYCKTADTLNAVDVGGDAVPSLIDEFPILCIAASCARGTTNISGAHELRVKESDRIKAMADGLKKMGIEIEEKKDGLRIKGGTLKGAEVESFGDHRIAMAFSVAALVAHGVTKIKDADAVEISFPEFYKILEGLNR